MRTKVLAAPEPVLHTVMCAWQWCHRGGVRCASAAHSSCGILADERMPSPRSALREPNRRETLLSPDANLYASCLSSAALVFSVSAVNASWFFFFFFCCECCWAPNRCWGTPPGQRTCPMGKAQMLHKSEYRAAGKVVDALEVGLLSRFLRSLDQLVKTKRWFTFTSIRKRQ